MCDYCTSDRECTNPTCASNGRGCACSLSGNEQCPSCGHPCVPWYWGMGLDDCPDIVRDFFGGDGTESPGFDKYPATKAQLLAGVRELQADMEEGTTPEDLVWLDQRLPEGTYPDAGEVFRVMTSVLRAPPLDSTRWVRGGYLRTFAAGTRLVVGANEFALLVGTDGSTFDAFGPGEHVLSADTAPLAAAVSRLPKPGFPKWALRAGPLYLSTSDQNGRVLGSGKTKSGEPIGIMAKVSFWLQDPSKFARSPAGRRLDPNLDIDRMLASLAKGALDTLVASLESPSLEAIQSSAESAVRSSLEAAGLGVRTVSIEVSGPRFGFGASFRAPPPTLPPEVLARLPPETVAKMNAATQRREEILRAAAANPNASHAAPPGSPGTPLPVVTCPSCHTPNARAAPFCRNCGVALAAQKFCPSCGHAVAPGVKFCGKCGTRVVPSA